MPTSATGNSDAGAGARFPSGNRGFTLIELLVALAIVAVMSAVVVLALPDPHGRLVEEAEKFAARTVAARDTAIVSARATRLAVDAGGYRFAQRQGGAWRDMIEKPLSSARWEEGTKSSEAQIEFDPTGLAAPPARIVLERGDEKLAVVVGSDGDVRVGG